MWVSLKHSVVYWLVESNASHLTAAQSSIYFGEPDDGLGSVEVDVRQATYFDVAVLQVCALKSLIR